MTFSQLFLDFYTVLVKSTALTSYMSSSQLAFLTWKQKPCCLPVVYHWSWPLESDHWSSCSNQCSSQSEMLDLESAVKSRSSHRSELTGCSSSWSVASEMELKGPPPSRVYYCNYWQPYFCLFSWEEWGQLLWPWPFLLTQLSRSLSTVTVSPTRAAPFKPVSA